MIADIWTTIVEMLDYTFIQRALVVGLLVSVCASLLGVSLVLKRYAMIGEGLSHVGFGSLAIATALNAAPLQVSIPIVVLAAFLLLRISENGKIKGDAAIAIISSSSLAIGVVVVSQTTGMNTDVCNYLFGSILAMSRSDVYLSVALAIVVLTLFVVFYQKIFAVTFDENFAKATGVKTSFYSMVVAFLTAITITLGMRMMGALLISSLVVFPALSSMRICKKFRSVTICAAIISVLCFVIGVIMSYFYVIPTGASVVLVNIAVFVLFWILRFLSVQSKKRANKKKEVIS
ncbi:MAG: metal ABC transporter permease [Oscillospiraceae bacterium]|jgi:zinc transport system permease protein|nr:metal ABC transporter permease [Oscillospiraceae bacterium]